MSGEQTLRAIHERCRSRHAVAYEAMGAKGAYVCCDYCDETWPCEDYSDAVAALNLLGKSDEAYGNEKTSPHPYWRLVWDPDGYVPDPLPSGSSMPATPHETKETT